MQREHFRMLRGYHFLAVWLRRRLASVVGGLFQDEDGDDDENDSRNGNNEGGGFGGVLKTSQRLWRWKHQEADWRSTGFGRDEYPHPRKISIRRAQDIMKKKALDIEGFAATRRSWLQV